MVICMKGQISAEMLIVLAVVIAVAVFLAMQLTSMAQKSANETNRSMMDLQCQHALMRVGLDCNEDSDCGFGMVCSNDKCEIDTSSGAPCAQYG